MKLEALKELAAKVEAGTDWPSLYGGSPASQNHYKAIKSAMDSESWEIVERVPNAYRGSMDAAKALHDAVLPELAVVMSGTPGKHAMVNVGNLKATYWADGSCFARAWLLAILRALIAREESNG